MARFAEAQALFTGLKKKKDRPLNPMNLFYEHPANTSS